MSLIEIIGIVTSILIPIIIQEVINYRRRKKDETINQKYAREEATTLMEKLISGHEELQPSIIETLINGEFKERNISQNLAINILPDIINDIIYKCYHNDYISETDRKRIVDRALNFQNKMVRPKSDFKEMLTQWKKVSKFSIVMEIFRVIIFGLVAWYLFIFTFIIISVIFKLPLDPNFDTIIWGSLLIILEAAILRYFSLKNERRIARSHFIDALQNALIEFISVERSGLKTERQVPIDVNGLNMIANIVFDFNGRKLPLEISVDNVNQSDIERLKNIATVLNSKRSLFVMASKASGKVKKVSESLNVLIVDDIHSESDINNQLKWVELF